MKLASEKCRSGWSTKCGLMEDKLLGAKLLSLLMAYMYILGMKLQYIIYSLEGFCVTNVHGQTAGACVQVEPRLSIQWVLCNP